MIDVADEYAAHFDLGGGEAVAVNLIEDGLLDDGLVSFFALA